MHMRMCTDHTTCKPRQDTRLIAQLSELKPIMLVSSVQAVVYVACNATAPRVCTLVLFIFVVFGIAIPMYTCTCTSTVPLHVHFFT